MASKPTPKPKNKKTAQAKADFKQAIRVVAKSLNLAPAAVKSLLSQDSTAIGNAMVSLMDEKPKMRSGGMVMKKKMRGGGMMKTAAKKKMMRGGAVAKKKMMRGGMAAKKRGK